MSRTKQTTRKVGHGPDLKAYVASKPSANKLASENKEHKKTMSRIHYQVKSLREIRKSPQIFVSQWPLS